MKRCKILVVGLIALLMAGGLVLAGCEKGGCPSTGNCEITVSDPSTGMTLKNVQGSSCSESSCAAYEASKNTANGTYKCNC